jgi:hypothetical protein
MRAAVWPWLLYNVLKSHFLVINLIVESSLLFKSGLGTKISQLCAEIYLLSHRKTSKITTSRKVTNSVVLSTLNRIDENTTFKTNGFRWNIFTRYFRKFGSKCSKPTTFWPENIFVRNCYICGKWLKSTKNAIFNDILTKFDLILVFLELENSIFRCSRLKIPTLPDKIVNANGFLRDNHIFLLVICKMGSKYFIYRNFNF